MLFTKQHKPPPLKPPPSSDSSSNHSSSSFTIRRGTKVKPDVVVVVVAPEKTTASSENVHSSRWGPDSQDSVRVENRAFPPGICGGSSRRTCEKNNTSSSTEKDPGVHASAPCSTNVVFSSEEVSQHLQHQRQQQLRQLEDDYSVDENNGQSSPSTFPCHTMVRRPAATTTTTTGSTASTATTSFPLLSGESPPESSLDRHVPSSAFQVEFSHRTSTADSSQGCASHEDVTESSFSSSCMDVPELMDEDWIVEEWSFARNHEQDHHHHHHHQQDQQQPSRSQDDKIVPESLSPSSSSSSSYPSYNVSLDDESGGFHGPGRHCHEVKCPSSPRQSHPSSPKARHSTIRKSALKSSLKSSSMFHIKNCNDGSGNVQHQHCNIKSFPFGGRPATERRVRGLWNDAINNDCHLARLRDETIVRIVGYLNLAEMIKLSMIAKRYESIILNSNKKQLWQAVDATEFVQTAHCRFLRSTSSNSQAQKQTGEALEYIWKRLGSSTMTTSLTIRHIHNCLSADSYLPSLPSLQELTLTHFEDLTDTHIHVLLLMMSKKRTNNGSSSSSLKTLALMHCLKLSNASIRSIASQCPLLELLQLEGCINITNLEPLSGMFIVTEAKSPLHLTAKMRLVPPAVISGTSSTNNKFLNMFGQSSTKPTPKLPNGGQPPFLLNMWTPPSPAPMHIPPASPASTENAGSNYIPSSNMSTPPSSLRNYQPAMELSSMFAPPGANPLQPTVGSPPRSSTPLSVSPSRTASPSAASSLQSLFAPPGMSPPRAQTPCIPSLKNQSSRGLLGFPSTLTCGAGVAAAAAAGGGGLRGKLQELHIVGTGVSPAAVLKIFQMATARTVDDDSLLSISLRSLSLDGNHWNDSHIDQLGDLLVWNNLTELSLPCSSSPSSASHGMLTDDALSLLASKHRFSKLTQLNLSGQAKLTGRGLAQFLQQAPKISTLHLQSMPMLLKDTTAFSVVAPLMKQFRVLHEKKHVLRFVDLRDCHLEPLVEEFVKSTLLCDSTNVKTTGSNPVASIPSKTSKSTISSVQLLL